MNLFASDEVREAVERAASLVADRREERLVMIDHRTGDVLFTNVGSPHAVSGPEDTPPCVVVHNHPGQQRDVTFSYGDLAMVIKYDIPVAIVVTSKRVHVLTRPRRSWAVELAERPGAKGYALAVQRTKTDEERLRAVTRFAVAVGAGFTTLPRSFNHEARWTASPAGVASAWPC